MKIQAKINLYYKTKKSSNFLLAKDEDMDFIPFRSDYELETRFEIQTYENKKSDYTPIILASKVIKEDPENPNKVEYISFRHITYTYSHIQKRVVCATTIQKL